MNKLKFGISDHFSYSMATSAGDLADAYSDLLRGAQEAEHMGFEYYSIGEHQGNDDAVFNSPQVWLGAVAQATSSIRLNTLVYQLPFQNPLRLAQDTALVDQISRGRLDFGYGTGVWVHEFMRWKLPFEERRAMSEEAMEIIKKAWTEEIVTYEGKYWQFEEALPWPQPYQKPHPPIWMAASSPSTFDLVAKMNYNLAQSLDPEDETARKHKIWEEKWKEHGHEGPMPLSSLNRRVYIAESDEEAREEIEPYLIKNSARAVQTGGSRVGRTKIGFQGGNPDKDEFRDYRKQVFEKMATGLDYWIDSGLALIGSPDTVARRIEDQQKLVGYDILVCQFGIPELPEELKDRSRRLFAEEVLPAFS